MSTPPPYLSRHRNEETLLSHVTLIALLTASVVSVTANAQSEGPSESGAAPAATVDPALRIVPPDSGARALGFLPQASLAGSVGLLHMGTAEVGGPKQFRLGLHGEFFSTRNFLVRDAAAAGGDKNARTQGALTFGATITDNVEIFGAVLESANRNQRLCAATVLTGAEVCQSEVGRTDPEIIKTFGDLILGAKVADTVTPALSLGGEFGLRLMSSVTGVSFSPSATSLWVNALASYDLQKVRNDIPIRFHANLGYYVDNSDNLIHYSNINTALSRYVSRFAYGISSSRFRLALGIDAPLHEVQDGFSLRPILEYHFEALTGSADAVVADFCAPSCDTGKTQRWMTLGIQGQMLQGLTVTAGLDFASKSVGEAYGPPLPPWNLLFGVGYPMDLVPRIITHHVPVERIVTKDAPLREGWVIGKVLTATETPIERAIIGITGRALSRVVSDADGSFRSPLLPPGPVELVVTADGFEDVTIKSNVVAGQTANATAHMTSRTPSARVTGRILDALGRGLVAAVRLTGPQIIDTKSDEAGNFTATVAVGAYVVRAEGEQSLAKEARLTAAVGQDNTATLTLRTRPGAPGVVFQEGKLKLRQAIAFRVVARKPSAELAEGMAHLLDEVVDILITHPEIRQLRIEAYGDRFSPTAKAQALSDEQAKAVAKYLVDQGIPAERIVAVGLGRSAKRRIELTVVN